MSPAQYQRSIDYLNDQMREFMLSQQLTNFVKEANHMIHNPATNHKIESDEDTPSSQPIPPHDHSELLQWLLSIIALAPSNDGLTSPNLPGTPGSYQSPRGFGASLTCLSPSPAVSPSGQLNDGIIPVPPRAAHKASNAEGRFSMSSSPTKSTGEGSDPRSIDYDFLEGGSARSVFDSNSPSRNKTPLNPDEPLQSTPKTAGEGQDENEPAGEISKVNDLLDNVTQPVAHSRDHSSDISTSETILSPVIARESSIFSQTTSNVDLPCTELSRTPFTRFLSTFRKCGSPTRGPILKSEMLISSIIQLYENENCTLKGLDILIFEREICQNILNIGKFFSHTLFERICGTQEETVSLDALLEYASQRFVPGGEDSVLYDCGPCPDEKLQNAYCNRSILNFFNTVKSDHAKVITRSDIFPFIKELVNRHPSLDFLRSHDDFAVRYSTTVIELIFYELDKQGNGKIRLKDLRRSNLVHIWCSLDNDVEVTALRKFFSYEHFYVIYWEFYSLDEDQDMFLSREDLVRYGDHGLSLTAVDRIFAEAPMSFSSAESNRIAFDDFIWIIMACEDATNDRAIEFWFKVIDLDDDGCIRDHEIKVFFELQKQRLLALMDGVDVTFNDFLCQMNDAICPKREGQYYLSDFTACSKYSSIFLQALVNVHRFFSWEQKDVHADKQMQDMYPGYTPWEIFCKEKYLDLAMPEQDQEEDEYSSTGEEELNPKASGDFGS